MEAAMVTCVKCGRDYNGLVLRACPACQHVGSSSDELETAKRRLAEEEARGLRVGLMELQLDKITTLQSLPGYATVRTLGLVFSLQGASGLTAGVKGREAVMKAMTEFYGQAQARGANAILGVHFSMFGAGGGLTNVFGGDAVGALLVGTAAIVEVAEVRQ